MPLKVLLTITKPPFGSRAARWMFDSVPCRRPEPQSTPMTTRSSRRTFLILSHAAPRLPASYGDSSAFAITPSCPAAIARS